MSSESFSQGRTVDSGVAQALACGPMKFQIENLPEAIREAKLELRQQLPAYASVFHEVENEIRRKVAQIVKEREAGRAVIPVLSYQEIAAGTVAPELISKIKDRGACVIRETFSPE